MCGPLTVFLYRNTQGNRLATLMVQVGRITTYLILGVLSASAGRGISLAPWFGKGKMVMGALLGLLLLYWGLAILLPSLPRPVKTTRWLEQKVFASLRKEGKGVWAGWRTGLLWGLIPCGFLYAMLLNALAIGGGPWFGAAALLLFGLGTLPAVVGTAWLGVRSNTTHRQTWHRLGGVLITALGLWQLVRVFVPALRWQPVL